MSYSHRARKKEIKREKRRSWLEEQAEREIRAAKYKPKVDLVTTPTANTVRARPRLKRVVGAIRATMPGYTRL